MFFYDALMFLVRTGVWFVVWMITGGDFWILPNVMSDEVNIPEFHIISPLFLLAPTQRSLQSICILHERRRHQITCPVKSKHKLSLFID